MAPITRKQKKTEEEVAESGFDGDNEGSPNRQRHEEDLRNDHSVKTGRTNKSVVRKAHVAAMKEIQEKKNQLDAERIQIEEKTREVLSAYKKAQNEVKKLERALLKADKNSPGYDDLEDMLNEARSNVEMLAEDCERAKGKEERELERLQGEMDILRAEKEDQILDLEEGEDGSQKLSDDDDVVLDPPNPKDLQIEEWRKKNEALRIAQEEADKKLAEQLQLAEEDELKAQTALASLKEEQLKVQANLAASKARKETLKVQIGSVDLTQQVHTPKCEPPMTEAAGSNKPALNSSAELLSKMFARQSSSRFLPDFTGNAEEWPNFINVYRRTSTECGFSNPENLDRLRRSLKGEALLRVQLLLNFPDNVPKIIEILEKAYGNPDFIIRTMLLKLQKFPPMREHKDETLIEFGLKVIQIVSTMEILGAEDHMKNPTLISELEHKLPSDLQRDWIKWTIMESSRKRDLRNFTAWLENNVEVATTLRLPKEIEEKSKFQKGKDFRKTERPGRCLAAVDEKFKKGERKCHACEKPGHFAGECRVLLKKTLEDKWKIVKEKKLCSSCLIPGHIAEHCRRKKKCTGNGCQEFHHPALHKESPTSSLNSNSTYREETPTAPFDVSHSATREDGNTLLTVLPVTVKGPKGEEKCLAFVDTGSSFSFIDEDLAKSLGLQGETDPICMQTMNSTRTCGDSRRVSCTIRGSWSSSKKYYVENIRTIDSVPLPRLSQDAAQLKQQYPMMNSFPLPSFNNEKPQILLGNDLYQLTGARRLIDVGDGVSIFQSKLGWGLAGKTTRTCKHSTKCVQMCSSEPRGVCKLMQPPDVRVREEESECRTSDLLNITGTAANICFLSCQGSSESSLETLIRESYSTEDFGVKYFPKRESVENEEALRILQETTVRTKSGRFQTGLLWKDKNVKMPDSRKTAMHRLFCQEKKMDRDPVFAAEYCGKMKEYEEKGFIRKLTPEEVKIRSDREWFLPHFIVYNPNKPGKARLVFDAKAKTDGVSLNDVLSSGPDLNQPLAAVLLKFRQHQYAYAGDVKDMFHRVFIQPEDRVSQRFYWRGMRRDGSPDVYEVLVMMFGTTCSPSSAQFVKNLNAEDYVVEFPEASAAIKWSFYVDDLLRSSPTIEEAKKMIREIIDIQNKCGYETRNWISNNVEVNASIPEDYRSKELREIGEEELPTGRVLGLWWDAKEDNFMYRVTMHKVDPEILQRKRIPTKRETLRVLMSVYDPLGFLGHLMVKGKILQQEIWRRETAWDDKIPEDLNERWNMWMDEVIQIVEVRVPRCYSINIPIATNIQLHLFCDASEQAFAAVAFLRVESPNGIEIALVTSRNRVAPLKSLSIPRMELQAALMATRLAAKIQEVMEIKIDSTSYWTDSMTVLKWIRSDTRNFKPFISHRIGEILESTCTNQWRYVPTLENVADDATRVNTPTDLDPSGRWFTGPRFLYKNRKDWPREKSTKELIVNPEDMEIKATVMLAHEEESSVDFKKFGSLQTALEIIAQEIRVKEGNFQLDGKEFSVAELEVARKELVRMAQATSFPGEIRDLNGGKPVSNKSRLFKLEPYLDGEGIIRVTGRLGNGPNEDLSHPAILDQHHHFTTLVIQWYHEVCGHQGQRTVANEVRQRYWVLGGMNAIKKIFRDCPKCKMLRGKPGTVKMADLPAVRMRGVRPFYDCGLDYFGPLTIVNGRKTEKRWGAIFTCLATRAIHLEIAGSLSTDSAIQAIQRMSNRRGRPAHIYSDNGTNFHGAHMELKKALSELDQEEIQRNLTKYEIEWHFNPPAAPHMGGVWERLVGSVKRTMEGIIKDKNLREETLHTLFTEVEFIINSRPLTDVPVDPKDPSCLTPNDLLLGYSSGSQAVEVVKPVWGHFDKDDLILRKRWRAVQLLADRFWSRWLKEYIPTLTRRQKWMETKTKLEVNDIVLVVDDTGPRHSWPVGKIVATFPGKDGETRVVEITTPKGTYRRPVTKIVKLDIAEDEVPSSGGRMWGCDAETVGKAADCRRVIDE